MLSERAGALVLVGVVIRVLASAGPAQAEPGGYLDQDETFQHLLTAPDESGTGMVITNFELLRTQKLKACQVMENGHSGYTATKRLQAEGPPYLFDATSLM